MFEWYKNQKLWVKISISLAIVIAIVLFFIFVPKYTGPEENCTFIGERINLHNEYYITVTDVDDFDTIYVIKTPGETNKSELIGTDKNYIGVTVKIEHQQLDNPKETHEFDLDDFKLKDHTGVQLKNFNFFSKENGLALETKDFTTKKPVADYSWLGTSIESGDSLEFTIYYEFSKTYSIYNTLMVLEADFFGGRSGGKAGSDIVLAYRTEQNKEAK